MIQKNSFTLCLVLATFYLAAQPKVEFKSRSVDFGNIVEGSISIHRFHYQNIGTQPFVISHVSVTCGCTAPQWSKSELLPGDTASVYIEFDSKNKMGPVHKGVNLMTNCEEPLIGLLIYANIIPDSNFIPLVDSVALYPLRLVKQKSFSQIGIPMATLAKKGFKGNSKDAETLFKYILKQNDNTLLYDHVWVTSENNLLMANLIDKNLQTPTVHLIQTEMLSKKRLKYWISATKAH